MSHNRNTKNLAALRRLNDLMERHDPQSINYQIQLVKTLTPHMPAILNAKIGKTPGFQERFYHLFPTVIPCPEGRVPLEVSALEYLKSRLIQVEEE